MSVTRPSDMLSIFEGALDHISEGVALFDGQERLFYFNEAYARLLAAPGRPLKVGTTAEELAATGQLAGAAEAAAVDTDGLSEQPGLRDFRSASGQPSFRRSQDGRLHSVLYARLRGGVTIVTWTDVTKQQRYLESLRVREAYLRRTLETVSEGVIGIDAAGIIDSYNPAAQRIFGYQPGEVIGRNVRMLMPPALAGAHDACIRRYLDTGAARIIGVGREVSGRRKSGETFPMMLAIGQIEAPGGVRFVGTIRDISHTRAIETQLRHAEKMQAIGQLTEGLAHDFNNLLTIILGNLRALERKTDLAATAQALVAAALGATKQAAEVTSRLSAFSRQPDGQPVVVGPATVVSDMIDMLSPILGERITVAARIDPAVGAIRVDLALLQNALVNLAINARDAMAGSGTLTFSVRMASPVERERSAGVLANLANVVVLEVADDGQGMTQEVIKHAVEPFFTTKPVGEGSGLGLSMVYRFVQQSGGDLQIESAVGAGTKIKLLLPATDGSSPRSS